MAKQIKFQGQIHSFPDDATEEEMNALLPGYNPEPSLLNKVGNEISGAYHMPLGRSLKNIGQGAVDLGEFVTNPAGPMMEFLAKQGIPYVSEGAKHWPQYPKSDIFGLGEQQPGDTIFQAATPVGSLAKIPQLAGKSLEQVAKMALSKAPQIANKVGDILPILKSMTSKPYKKQMNVLKEKDLLTGYKPNVNDVLEASDLLKSPGMTIPHAAVDEAVAQALEGNFKPWHDLQSSVKSEGRRLSKMGGVHNTLGQKLYKLGEKMHTEMGEAQIARGAPEAAELMNQGKLRTARHHKMLPYRNIAIGLGLTGTAPSWIKQMIKALSK